MRSLGRRRAVGLLALTGVMTCAAASCREPAQVTLLARTNVPYRDNVTVGLWSSNSGMFVAGAEPDSKTTEPWPQTGVIGDLVFRPRSRSDEALSLRMVMGVGRDPKTCTDADAKGCIVAKRRLAFVPHARLRVPMVLHLACEGVVCASDSTCNYLGSCVPATVDPSACSSPAGCELPGDETVTAVADAGVDAFVEDVRDASVDALPAVCVPGNKEPCYSGPAGTVGRGSCRAGERTCDVNGQWGACAGEVVPRAESCSLPGDDDDCDGIPSCQLYVHDATTQKALRVSFTDSSQRLELGTYPTLSDMVLHRAAMTLYFTQSNPNVQVSRAVLPPVGDGKLEVLFPGFIDPLQGIALDLAGGRVIWGAYYQGLYAGPLAGGVSTQLVPSALLAPGHGVGLGVEPDALTNSVFFTTRQNGAGNFIGRKIYSVNGDGTVLAVVRQLHNSSCLAIDAPRGVMYFVDSVVEAAPQNLYRANLDGSNAVVLNAKDIVCRSMVLRPSDGNLLLVLDVAGRGVLHQALIAGTGGTATLQELFPQDLTLNVGAFDIDLPN